MAEGAIGRPMMLSKHTFLHLGGTNPSAEDSARQIDPSQAASVIGARSKAPYVAAPTLPPLDASSSSSAYVPAAAASTAAKDGALHDGVGAATAATPHPFLPGVLIFGGSSLLPPTSSAFSSSSYYGSESKTSSKAAADVEGGVGKGEHSHGGSGPIGQAYLEHDPYGAGLLLGDEGYKKLLDLGEHVIRGPLQGVEAAADRILGIGRQMETDTDTKIDGEGADPGASHEGASHEGAGTAKENQHDERRGDTEPVASQGDAPDAAEGPEPQPTPSQEQEQEQQQQSDVPPTPPDPSALVNRIEEMQRIAHEGQVPPTPISVALIDAIGGV